MFNRRLLLAAWCSMLACGACSCGGDPAVEKLPAPFERLRPLAKRLGEPQPGEWLAEHVEYGQTYDAYLHSRPVRATAARRTIYVQPLGEFSATQRKIIDLTARYMGDYFGLPVRVQEDLALDVIPAEARRVHPAWGDRQILSTYVLDKVLYPGLPKDAVARIAFTASDLWPGEGWNFVFGQASLRNRVAVWSVYRNGDPEQGDEAFRLCLRRTLKTATHETGHMFSLAHCIWYECNMCGSNHREESDRHPLWLCPICLSKLCWATKIRPEDHFRRLAAFAEEQGMKAEAEFYRRSLEAVGTK